MRDGKEVKPPHGESPKTGTGFALNYPIDSDGRASRGVQGGLVSTRHGLGMEAAREFRGKPQFWNRSFAGIVRNYMTKVVVA
jgi:hypothetical protein